jgi:2,4-dienoyl-CoA reductase-like NADH-dependent reductase (Old Yellow Enzyme family)
MSLLHTPLRVGAFHLPNRIVMAPLTRCRAGARRVPTALMAEYYRQRAGAGLIISEATAVDPMGVGYPDTPGIWSAEQVAGWKTVTKAVHDAGGLIMLQLWHVGRISHPVYLNGASPVAPSALAASGHVSLLRPYQDFPVPRVLDRSELPGVIEAYHRGAQNALEAGFDGVELHGANGYLLDQFLQDGSNRRTDDYGGPVENRARLMLEAVDAAISVWGADRVGLHLAPRGDSHDIKDSNPLVTFGYVAREAGRRGLAFLCAREGLDEPRLGPELKKAFGGIFVANQGFTAETAEAEIAAGRADAVAWGKLFIANPDLPERFRSRAVLNAPVAGTFYGGSETGYTDYPALNEVS